MARDPGSHLGGGSSSGGSASDRWPFSGSDYIDDDGDGVWSRLDLAGLVKDNVAGFLTLLGGVLAAATQAVPNAVTAGLDGLRSFAVDVVDHLFGFPQEVVDQGFSAAAADIANSGLAGMAAGTLLVGASIFTIAIGVNEIVG